ncbi:MAG: hypothetical protein IH951_15115 [Bacteroidetes bacterium]|nr:hypothetical protein [Bacteroidota bacterium]
MPTREQPASTTSAIGLFDELQLSGSCTGRISYFPSSDQQQVDQVFAERVFNIIPAI